MGCPEELQRLATPYVIGGRPTGSDAAAPYVDSENLMGAEFATRHLVALGRRTIGTRHGPAGHAGRRRPTGRVPRTPWGRPSARTLVESGDFTQRRRRGSPPRACWQRVPDLDGLFAASDLMALGALAALRRAGRRVPEDVALVGFDDNEFASTADPPLTTVRQDPMIMGRAMVRLYLARHRPDIEVAPEVGIPDVTGLDHLILPVSLVVRDSA